MKNSLVEAFNYKRKTKSFDEVNDYEIFPNKELLETLRTKIIENLIDKEMPQDKLLNQFVNDEIDKTIEGYDLTNLERSHLYNLIDNEINGYGPLTELLEDKNITEIMVNSPNEIYIEIDGQLIRDESVSFINDEHIVRTIERMIGPMGRTIDATNPMVDSRLKDGSRINAVIPPLSTKGPVITIRKFKRELATIEDLLRIGSMTPYMATFLDAAVRGKCNILVCGGTGSGKTTLLNILSGFIPDNERIITIEDAAELKLEKEHVISLETRVTNYDTDGEITIRDLVINALRMRPDRIIVGEVRGKEAFDMLQAMNTGHEGSLTTLHANGPHDALNRLETMVLMSGLDIPVKAIREYIVSAIDLVINALRMRPDRIIVGEVRGKEAFDMLQAMNTGHEGSLTTLHANGPHDALNRLETMVLMSGLDIPVKAIREYIVSAIDLVVNIERMSDGKRKITSISELTGLNNGEIALREIFGFKLRGLTNKGEVDGEYIFNGLDKSKVYNKIKGRGINIEELFK